MYKVSLSRLGVRPDSNLPIEACGMESVLGAFTSWELVLESELDAYVAINLQSFLLTLCMRV